MLFHIPCSEGNQLSYKDFQQAQGDVCVPILALVKLLCNAFIYTINMLIQLPYLSIAGMFLKGVGTCHLAQKADL